MTQTVLQLLEMAPLDKALDQLESLVKNHPPTPGEQIPFDQIPLMPLGTPVVRFAAAWDTRLTQATKAQRYRMSQVEPWLHAIGAVPRILH